jgi:hypothetical protein
MKHIIEKANEIREKYGVDDLELLASKLGAEVARATSPTYSFIVSKPVSSAR